MEKRPWTQEREERESIEYSRSKRGRGGEVPHRCYLNIILQMIVLYFAGIINNFVNNKGKIYNVL